MAASDAEIPDKKAMTVKGHLPGTEGCHTHRTDRHTELTGHTELADTQNCQTHKTDRQTYRTDRYTGLAHRTDRHTDMTDTQH